jgi:hypothetical protein
VEAASSESSSGNGYSKAWAGGFEVVRTTTTTRRKEMEEDKVKRLVRYSPKKHGRRWVTRTTAGRNGGLHRQEEFRKGVRMLEHCARHFRNPRLFHICFTGAGVPVYQSVMQRFCRVLKAEGVAYKWKGAVEEDAEKGLHCHVMIVLGCEYQTHRFITSVDEAEKIEGESALRKAWRHTLADCSLLKYRVNPPQCRKGQKVAFIQFNQSNQEFFDEAVEWMSYAYKARSKPEAGTVYFSDKQGGR